MLNKLLFAVVFGLCAATAPLGAQDTATATSPTGGASRVAGQIIAARVRGTVTATDLVSGASREIHDGDKLSEHYRVNTTEGASIILVFENGATLDLGSATSLNIDEFQKDPFKAAVKMSELKHERGTSITKLSLIRGELVGKVVHLNIDQGSEFTVDTPVGAAGIRGTTFRIVFKPDGNGKVFFSVTTADGRVLLTGTTSSVSIPAGKQVSVTVNIPTTANSGTNGTGGSGGTPPVQFETKNTSTAEQAFIESIASNIVAAASTVTVVPSNTPGSYEPPVQGSPTPQAETTPGAGT